MDSAEKIHEAKKNVFCRICLLQIRLLSTEQTTYKTELFHFYVVTSCYRL